MLNIFDSIRSTTSRTEPFHSRFLADALKESLMSEERSLFDDFWRLAAPDGWVLPNSPVVHSEHDTGAGRRIDICIVDDATPGKRVLGIEVKTVSASARSGQLEAYRQGLTDREEFRGADIAIAYLTPFNRQRAGPSADLLSTIRVFEEFAQLFPQSRHVSWLDVAETEWDRDIWRQHQSHVRETIAPLSKLQRGTLHNQSFDEFFGAEPAGLFWEALAEIGVVPGEAGAEVNLAELQADADLLVRAFEILIRDGEGLAGSEKPDQFANHLRCSFIASRERDFHRALFDLSRRFGNVWVEGRKDYAIRVAHERYGNGVSLVRSRGTQVLETGRPRRAKAPQGAAGLPHC